MKVTILADTLDGGLGALAIEHANFLGQRHDVTLLAPHTVGVQPTAFKLVGLDYPGNFRAAVQSGTARAIKNDLDRHRPDVVHAHGMRSFALARISSCRSIWLTEHGFARLPGSSPSHSLARRGVRRLVPALAQRAFSVGPDCPPGWRFLPHSSPRLRQLSYVGVGTKPVFAWLGRLEAERRPELFVAALARLRGQACGVMIGAGSRFNELRDQARRENVDLTMVGHDADIQKHLRPVRAVTILSHYEGIPLAAQEAMWMGKPVILSDLPGNRWLAGDEGFYASNVAEVARAMTRLLDPTFACQSGVASRRRVEHLIRPGDPWEALEQMYMEHRRQ